MVVHCQLRCSEEDLGAEERCSLRHEGAMAAARLLAVDGSSSSATSAETQMIARSASAAHALAVVARHARINERARVRRQRLARSLKRAADRAAPVIVCSSCSTTSFADTVVQTSPEDMASMCLCVYTVEF